MKLTNTKRRFVSIIYGRPKSGKTILASQFPNNNFVDLDLGGIDSVASFAMLKNKEIELDLYTTDKEDEDSKRVCGEKVWLVNNEWSRAKALISRLCTTLGEESTLVIDNLSRASEMIINSISSKTHRKPLEIQDWNLFGIEITDLINTVTSRDVKCNVVMIAHELQETKSNVGERLLFMPTSAKHRVPSIVGDVWYMGCNQVRKGKEVISQRFLQTMPDPRTPAGSRFLIPNIQDPTYAKIRPHLKAALGRDPGEPTWTP